MIPIAKPSLNEAEINTVINVLRSGMIAEGVYVKEFEEAFADYIGVKYAVAVNSGTSALHAALLSHDIGIGDEVITTSFSFIATANSILFTGAKPVFADIEYDTFNIDPNDIINKITPKTKALMPVHLYGHSADMKVIMEIAQDYNLIVIEDACQAHGATCCGKKVGSFGTGIFSFYPTKNMTTGEGGMITTNDDNVVEYAKMVRSHGSKQRYVHEIIGYNMRMTNISAAIGLIQLEKLDNFIQIRQKNAKILSDNLQNIDNITIPTIRNEYTHVFHQYTLRVKKRDKFSEILKANGIDTGIYYPIPIHRQPIYKKLGYDDNLLECETAAQEVLSIPIHPAISKNELITIINCINNITNIKNIF